VHNADGPGATEIQRECAASQLPDQLRLDLQEVLARQPRLERAADRCARILAPVDARDQDVPHGEPPDPAGDGLSNQCFGVLNRRGPLTVA